VAYLNGAENERAEQREGREDESKKLVLTDDDFLSIVKAERRLSIGINTGDTILEEREVALEYYKGQMDDVPALPNRSKVVSSDVADAVHTALPDLIEIFIGGEELGSFRPVGEEDVRAAEQETQVVNHVIMNENDGFRLVHDAIHDALLTKVGVYHWWSEEDEQYEDTDLERATGAEVQLALQDGELVEIKEAGVDDMSGEPLYDVTIRRKNTDKCVKVDVVAPEDFAVARDTKRLADTTYCVMRTRPRAQDLKARGFDPEIVDELPVYSQAYPQLLDQARDLAGEHRVYTGASESTHDLRTVLIYKHIIRVDADGDGQPEIWQVETDEHEGVLLQKTKLSQVPFAAGTPYRAPHRFYGRSLADLLLEIQRIKTALMRLTLDTAFFAVNQRHEVVESTSSEHTISDLLNNQPGMPVRVKQAGTVTAIPPGALGFDPFAALEYVATVAEQRTGIVRNAQGLNPDTLHDTAKGAQQLMQAAQRRLRLIARTLAETLFRDLFVGVHQMLREHGPSQITARIKGQFIAADPTSWGTRKDMTIEIGMGGGREYDLMLLEAIKQDMAVIVEAQASGAIDGKVVSAKNLYALAVKRAERANIKGVTEFYTDPEANPEAKQPPPPDPQIVKAQMDQEAKREEMAMKERHTQMQFQKDMQLSEMQQRDDMARAQIEAEDKARQHELAVFQAQQQATDAERKHQIEMARIQLDLEKFQAEMEAKRRELDIKERDLSVREREMQQTREIEAARLEDGREARTVEMADRHAERQSRTKEPKEPAEKPEPKPDRSGEAIGKGLEALAAAMSRPKKLIRGEDGRPEGIE